jgi:hypothetical protein
VKAAVAFNEAINRHDLDAIEGLMSDGHTFIDSDGNALTDRRRPLGVLDRTGARRSAIWTASAADGKVSEWRVYEDTPSNRSHLGIAGDAD